MELYAPLQPGTRTANSSGLDHPSAPSGIRSSRRSPILTDLALHNQKMENIPS
jgi:hypothetical protein